MTPLKRPILLLSVLTMLLGGCSDPATRSVYDESEMAKYHSTPEEMEAKINDAMKASVPSQAEIRQMAAEAKATGNNAGN